MKNKINSACGFFQLTSLTWASSYPYNFSHVNEFKLKNNMGNNTTVDSNSCKHGAPGHKINNQQLTFTPFAFT